MAVDQVMLATDEVYQSIKDLNFSRVGLRLKEVAKEIGTHYDERHKATDIKELRKFVAKLGGLQVGNNMEVAEALAR